MGCSLIGADFAGAILRGADFTGTDLRRASFRNADAREAIFDRANVEDAEFIYTDRQGASLIDARRDRTLYTGTRVNRETEFGDRVIYETTAMEVTDRETVLAMFGAAMWTYRELERLLDENALPERSEDYYHREMDVRRRLAWTTRNYLRGLKLEGSHWVMRYGTSPWRVIGSSVVLIIGCALLYPLTEGIREPGIQTVVTYSLEDPTQAPIRRLLTVFLVSLYFSIITFSTLGYGDIQPVGGWERAVASAESLFGVLLLALLVYVLTREM